MDVLLPSVKSIVYTIKKCWLSIVDRKKVLLVNLFYEDTSAHRLAVFFSKNRAVLLYGIFTRFSAEFLNIVRNDHACLDA